MTEVQKSRKVKELLKYSGIDDYEIVVEINHEEHNLDFLVDGIRKKIIFFYEYGDGDDVLNELATKCSKLEKENEQLKQENNLKGDFRGFITKDIQKTKEENEQLKQFKEKVFVLIDEKIKYYEHKPISAPVGQPMSVNFDADVDRLARLSELQDLEKELKSE